MSIRVVLDPLSPQTQRIISDELYDYHGIFDIEILLNPVTDMKVEMNRYGFPKKLARYYGYVFNANDMLMEWMIMVIKLCLLICQQMMY